MIDDTELFRRTKYASWSIGRTQYGDVMNHDDETYAHHNGCKVRNENDSSRWSWFIGEDDGCYNCHAKVPDYIQALVRLNEGR